MGWGVGRGLDLACRLLDADQVKGLLRDSGAAMIFVATQHVFETVIQHAPQTIDPDDFTPVEVENKKPSPGAGPCSAAEPAHWLFSTY